MSLIGRSKLRGKHALFSPSTATWANYDDDKFIESFRNKYRTALGTEIHEWAAIQITLGQKYNSVRDIAKSIKTMIFEKNYSEEYGLSEYGQTLLNNFKYLPNSIYGTLKQYVNDGVGNFMVPEEGEGVLDYSDYFFGTCDALYFDENTKALKIFDLKTGSHPAKIEQLYIYAALYCLRNKVDPFEIKFDLRIYQNEEIIFAEPDSKEIRAFMDKIIHFDRLARKMAKGGAL